MRDGDAGSEGILAESEDDRAPGPGAKRSGSVGQPASIRLDSGPEVAATVADAEGLEVAPVVAEGEWCEGAVLLERYEVRGLLGRGGMGTVHRVFHRGWGVELAVKSPLAAVLAEVGGAEAFTAEAETWVGLAFHPHVVGCHYVLVVGGVPRVFVELVEGGSLADWIRDRRLFAGGPEAALARILDVAIQFAWGLDAAHEQGLVHQDVKPANLMMTLDGVAKVTDFGLARAGVRPTATGGGTVVVNGLGMTPAYASPEQVAGQLLTRRSDLWSWGVSVLEMFLGERSWPSGTVAASVLASLAAGEVSGAATMPSPVVDLLRQCFEDDPGRRPRTLAVVAEALQRAYENAVGRRHPRPRPALVRDSSATLNNRAVSLVDLGRPTHAVSLWDRVLEREPHHPETTFNRSLLLWRQGKLDDLEVVHRLEESCAAFSDDRSRRLLAAAHHERGDLQAAAAVLERCDASFNETRGMLEELRPSSGAGVSTLGGDGHIGPVGGLCFEPGGLGLVSAGSGVFRDGQLHAAVFAWDLVSGRCARSLGGGQPYVGRQLTRATLFPHRRELVSVTSEGTLCRWDLESGSCTLVREGVPMSGATASAGPQGQAVLCTGDFRGGVDVVEVATGKVLRSLDGHVSQVLDLAVTTDGRLAVTADFSGGLLLWDLATGDLARTLAGHPEGLSRIGIDGAGSCLVTGADDGTLRLWDLATGGCVRTWAAHADAVSALAVSVDGTIAVSAGQDGVQRSWDLRNGCEVARVEDPGDPARALAVDDAGLWVASAGSSGVIRVWELASGRTLWTLGGGHVGQATAVASSPAGGAVVTADREGIILQWDLESETCRQAVVAGRSVQALRSAPGGRVVVNLEDRVRVLDPSSGRWVGELQLRGFSHVVVAPVDDHAELLLVAGSLEDGRLTAQLWERVGRRVLAFEPGVADRATAVGVAGGGRLGVLGCASGKIRLLDLGSGREIRGWQAHNQQVTDLEVAADGLSVVSVGDDGRLGWWGVPGGSCLRTVRHGEIQLSAVTFAGDGLQALAAGRFGPLFLWDLRQGRRLRTYELSSPGVVSGLAADGACRGVAATEGGILRVTLPEDWRAPAALCRLAGGEAQLSAQAEFDRRMIKVREALARRDFAAGHSNLEAARALPGYERDEESLLWWSELEQRLSRRGLRGVWQDERFRFSVRGSSLQVDARGDVGIIADGNRWFVWDGRSGEVTDEVRPAFFGERQLLVPDGSAILSYDSSRQASSLRLRPLAGGGPPGFLESGSGVRTVSVSPDLRWVAAVRGGDGVLCLWRSGDRFPVHQLPVDCAVTCLAFSRDGVRLSCGGPGQVLLLEVATAALERRVELTGGHLSGLSFSGDGRRLLVAREDGALEILDLSGLKPAAVVAAHESRCTGAEITPDGRFALTVGTDRTSERWSEMGEAARLWDLASGRCIRSFDGCADAVVRHDGRVLFTLDRADGLVRKWRLDWDLNPVPRSTS